MINVAIVGGGNISNTRHIPALRHIKEARMVGVISNKLSRAQSTAASNRIDNYSRIDIDLVDGGLEDVEWFKDVDAVIIGAPPAQHYALTKIMLGMGKHVLVEKPMMMNEAECEELIKLAKIKDRVFYVMHNFQYADNMIKLNKVIESGVHGDIVNITEVQFTNHDRRLPEWYNSLPMGLFYDEAAHFMYLLDRHGGALSVDNSFAVYDKDKDESTPEMLTVNARAGDVPVTMFLNFRSPVCEWLYIVSFKNRVYIYDFFKDILVDLPTDGEHRAPDILRNSLQYTFKYWLQFLVNGVKMVSGRLHYGHDRVIRGFIDAIVGGDINPYIEARAGLRNVKDINSVIDRANKRGKS